MEMVSGGRRGGQPARAFGPEPTFFFKADLYCGLFFLNKPGLGFQFIAET